MKIKVLVLAAALALPAFAAANAATKEIKNGGFDNGWGVWSTDGKTSRVNNGGDGKAAQIGNSNKFGIITQSFELVTDGIFKLAFDYKASSPLTVLLTSSNGFTWGKLLDVVDFSSFSKKLNLGAGTYTLSFSSLNATVDNVSGRFTATTPVPGPEAGAGLGALALGGAALYLKRRRKSDVVA